MMGQLIGEKVVTVRRVAGYVVGAIAASMILGVGGAVAGVLDEPEQRADSLSLHSVNETLPINLKSADGREICVQVSRRLSDRMIPFLVEYELEDGGWLLIRFSGTEPIIRVYCETTDESKVEPLLDEGLKLAGLA